MGQARGHGQGQPEYPWRVVDGWKLGLVVVGALAVPVLHNWAAGSPLAPVDPGGGSMRIQDVSASLTVGLLLALPAVLLGRVLHRRRLGQHATEVRRREREGRAVLRRLVLEEARRRAAWRAGLGSDRAVRRAGYSPSVEDIDGATPAEFEAIVRRLFERDGLRAQVIGGRGDQAVDVLAVDAVDRRIAVQCKHTRRGRKVGSDVLYQINGTAEPVYAAGAAIVVTNGSFTRDAVKWASVHGIHLIDREALARWSAEADHLYQLVELRPPL
ncbi:restriction endonuclease [Streptomyces sp. NPDC059851]|uniref:restriction endonuclease n=1 Tax=Streptomyces sp. NPDC059851 TaxID=3346971 RepID=UPI0036615790